MQDQLHGGEEAGSVSPPLKGPDSGTDTSVMLWGWCQLAVSLTLSGDLDGEQTAPLQILQRFLGMVSRSAIKPVTALFVELGGGGRKLCNPGTSLSPERDTTQRTRRTENRGKKERNGPTIEKGVHPNTGNGTECTNRLWGHLLQHLSLCRDRAPATFAIREPRNTRTTNRRKKRPELLAESLPNAFAAPNFYHCLSAYLRSCVRTSSGNNLHDSASVPRASIALS
ncbi:uncharacterized protein EI90DRAFT_3042023, partial [Cantharellus anzutake]|uniref:uncharacterized protein n=1 Tax=Cantharellus anzutake TaxID=1750568 RepID=UPI001907C27E